MIIKVFVQLNSTCAATVKYSLIQIFQKLKAFHSQRINIVLIHKSYARQNLVLYFPIEALDAI